jgi:hypothetical protein
MKNKQLFYKVLLTVLLWRIGLFIIGGLADTVLSYMPSFPYYDSLLVSFNLPRWLYSWANFDGVHYLTIVQKGYIGTGLIQAFFPVYPGIVKLLSYIIPNQVIAGLLVSHLSLGLLLWGFLKLIRMEFPKWSNKQLLASLFVLMLFPTSFYFGAMYTESLFLAIVIWFFVFLKQEKWWLAAILASLAGATKVVGILLAISLAGVYIQANHKQIWQNKKRLFKLLGLMVVSSLGLLAYMMFLFGEFKDPLYFLHVQSEFGAGRQESLVLLPQVIWRYIKILFTARPFDFKYFSYVQDLGMSIVSGLLLIYGWRKKIDKHLLIFSILALLLPTLTGTLSSMPRYILSAPGVLLALSYWVNSHDKRLYFSLAVSTILLILNTLLFIQGYWVA